VNTETRYPTTAPGELFRLTRYARRRSLLVMSRLTGLSTARISEIERNLRPATLEEAAALWSALSNGNGS
jgi:hypothetical protein